MAYVPKPKNSFLNRFSFYKVIDGRKVYRGEDRYYSWDELHGEIEVFNKTGYHLGSIDAVSGERRKDAVKGRRINL